MSLPFSETFISTFAARHKFSLTHSANTLTHTDKREDKHCHKHTLKCPSEDTGKGKERHNLTLMFGIVHDV